MASDDTDEHRVDEGSARSDERSDAGYRNDDQDPFDESDLDALEDSGEDEGVRTAAVEEVDQRIVDLLSWILDTETRAKIYVYLLANPGSTSEEVAKGTGLYPSTVREALAELHDEDRVTREKRASEGAGNNPYEYTAIQPSELVGGVVDQVQRELNTIFTLDRVLDRREESEPDLEEDAEPVTITVDDTEPPEIEAEDTETAETTVDASVDVDVDADSNSGSDESESDDPADTAVEEQSDRTGTSDRDR